MGREHRFSLIEVMVVVAIILVLCTLAAGRLGVMPVAASLEKCERELELLFAQGAHLATIRNQPIEIVFVPEARTFSLDIAASDSNSEYLKKRFRSVLLPSGMEVEFPQREAADEVVRYRCFPDATAAGPDLILKYDTRRVRLKISPLTGQLLRQDNRRRMR